MAVQGEPHHLNQLFLFIFILFSAGVKSFLFSSKRFMFSLLASSPPNGRVQPHADRDGWKRLLTAALLW
ncbi:hypothetical protein EDC27_0176 [Desulfosoma caldarium]|uniref:Uncharacterized protein n=1 Tax=Desulfosoma caldarium TaxID=610254 RepID=A0A3N1VRQ5_9BACT|nr:hypothetical protein EDC27_0176 [Desulfosoma caldarium]